jgi:hypothetical protein
MKKVIFWDVMPCGSCKNRHFKATYRLHHQGGKNQQAGNKQASNPDDGGDTLQHKQ